MGAVYSQLSLKERRKIETWWHAKVPVAEMARVLKRHKSTIFREIKRNFCADDAFPKKYAGYFGHGAQLQTGKRRSVQRKLIRHPDLCKTMNARIKQDPLTGRTPQPVHRAAEEPEHRAARSGHCHARRPRCLLELILQHHRSAAGALGAGGHCRCGGRPSSWDLSAHQSWVRPNKGTKRDIGFAA